MKRLKFLATKCRNCFKRVKNKTIKRVLPPAKSKVTSLIEHKTLCGIRTMASILMVQQRRWTIRIEENFIPAKIRT